jgi:chromosome segregation ATPase
VQNLKDTIEGLQSDVASARERKDDELAQLVSGLEVKMKSLQVEVTKKVDSELSTVQKTVSNETTRINELEAKSTEMMSSMREELNAVKGKMNLHDNSVTDLQNSLNDIRTEQRNQLKELKSESERIQSLNSSRNETIRQLILELLDNITKQDQEMDEYQFFRDWLDNIFVNETELRVNAVILTPCFNICRVCNFAFAGKSGEYYRYYRALSIQWHGKAWR